MSRSMFTRLERLEQQRSACNGKNYMLLSEPDEPDDAFDARAEAYKAGLPDFVEGRDMLMCVHFVSPEFVRAQGEAA
jgi:hypothetical protein